MKRIIAKLFILIHKCKVKFYKIRSFGFVFETIVKHNWTQQPNGIHVIHNLAACIREPVPILGIKTIYHD